MADALNVNTTDVPESPRFQGLMGRLPVQIAQSFSPEQRAALSCALVADPTAHRIRYQVSLPVFGQRYYVALFAGRERRSYARLRAEGQLGTGRLAVICGLGLWLFFSISAVGAAMAVYLLNFVIDGDTLRAGLLLHP